MELGLLFQASVPGWALGVRFHRASNEFSAAYTGRLWNAAGTLLATCSFTNATGPGWAYAYFDAPVSLAANVNYTVSRDAYEYYNYTSAYFAAPATNNHLKVAANAGVYSNAKAGGPNHGAGWFPTSVWNGTNYWTDVIYQPNLAPHRIGGIYDAAAAHQLI